MSKLIDTGVSENDLLESIIAAMPPAYDPSVHVIAKVLAKRTGISENSALEHLNHLADEGKIRRLETDVRLPSGYGVAAFVRA